MNKSKSLEMVIIGDYSEMFVVFFSIVVILCFYV